MGKEKCCLSVLLVFSVSVEEDDIIANRTIVKQLINCLPQQLLVANQQFLGLMVKQGGPEGFLSKIGVEIV